MRKHPVLCFIIFLIISACSKNENIISEEGAGISANSIIDSTAVTSEAPDGYTGTGYDVDDLIEYGSGTYSGGTQTATFTTTNILTQTGGSISRG